MSELAFPWCIVYMDVRHVAGSPSCSTVEDVESTEPLTPVEQSERRGLPWWPQAQPVWHVVRDRAFVEDIVDANGKHVVCLGNHDYDDSGYVSPEIAALIVEAVNQRPTQETDPVQHDHRERVEGCFRCDLSAQETDPG